MMLENKISLIVRKKRTTMFLFFLATFFSSAVATSPDSPGTGASASAEDTAVASAVPVGPAAFWGLLVIRRASAMRGDRPWAFVLAHVRMRSGERPSAVIYFFAMQQRRIPIRDRFLDR